jgi:D-2-hydroxyacid dehydrogenase (NADP+)
VGRAMIDRRARLLVALRKDSELSAALDRGLPNTPRAFVTAASEGPWKEAEALLIGSPPGMLPEGLESQAPELRFVQSIFSGLDDFPFTRFRNGIMVAGNVGAYATYVAEHAVALILVLAKNYVPNYERVRNGILRPVPPNINLDGRTVLLLGFGATAREIAVRLESFNMRIHGLSRTGRTRPGVTRMFPSSRLHEAVSDADVIVDCRPLTRTTEGTINSSVLLRMKPTAIFVNVGRAGTVDESSLELHLASHRDFRAGTDVWWNEDLATGTVKGASRLTSFPNFAGSPHNAGFTPTMDSVAKAKVYSRAIENIERYFSGRKPRFLAERNEYLWPT